MLDSKQHFSLRKRAGLSLMSVLIGISFLGGINQSVKAATVPDDKAENENRDSDKEADGKPAKVVEHIEVANSIKQNAVDVANNASTDKTQKQTDLVNQNANAKEQTSASNMNSGQESTKQGVSQAKADEVTAPTAKKVAPSATNTQQDANKQFEQPDLKDTWMTPNPAENTAKANNKIAPSYSTQSLSVKVPPKIDSASFAVSKIADAKIADANDDNPLNTDKQASFDLHYRDLTTNKDIGMQHIVGFKGATVKQNSLKLPDGYSLAETLPQFVLGVINDPNSLHDYVYVVKSDSPLANHQGHIDYDDIRYVTQTIHYYKDGTYNSLHDDNVQSAEFIPYYDYEGDHVKITAKQNIVISYDDKDNMSRHGADSYLAQLINASADDLHHILHSAVDFDDSTSKSDGSGYEYNAYLNFTFDDHSHFVLPFNVTIRNNDTDASVITPFVPDHKVPVADPSNLTKDEQDKVQKKVEDANKGNFPLGTTVEVDDTGDAKITYPDTSSDTIPGDILVFQLIEDETIIPDFPTSTLGDEFFVSEKSALHPTNFMAYSNLAAIPTADPNTGMLLESKVDASTESNLPTPLGIGTRYWMVMLDGKLIQDGKSDKQIEQAGFNFADVDNPIIDGYHVKSGQAKTVGRYVTPASGNQIIDVYYVPENKQTIVTYYDTTDKKNIDPAKGGQQTINGPIVQNIMQDQLLIPNGYELDGPIPTVTYGNPITVNVKHKLDVAEKSATLSYFINYKMGTAEDLTLLENETNDDTIKQMLKQYQPSKAAGNYYQKQNQININLSFTRTYDEADNTTRFSNFKMTDENPDSASYQLLTSPNGYGFNLNSQSVYGASDNQPKLDPRLYRIVGHSISGETLSGSYGGGEISEVIASDDFMNPSLSVLVGNDIVKGGRRVDDNPNSKLNQNSILQVDGSYDLASSNNNLTLYAFKSPIDLIFTPVNTDKPSAIADSELGKHVLNFTANQGMTVYANENLTAYSDENAQNGQTYTDNNNFNIDLSSAKIKENAHILLASPIVTGASINNSGVLNLNSDNYKVAQSVTEPAKYGSRYAIAVLAGTKHEMQEIIDPTQTQAQASRIFHIGGDLGNVTIVQKLNYDRSVKKDLITNQLIKGAWHFVPRPRAQDNATLVWGENSDKLKALLKLDNLTNTSAVHPGSFASFILPKLKGYKLVQKEAAQPKATSAFAPRMFNLMLVALPNSSKHNSAQASAISLANSIKMQNKLATDDGMNKVANNKAATPAPISTANSIKFADHVEAKQVAFNEANGIDKTKQVVAPSLTISRNRAGASINKSALSNDDLDANNSLTSLSIAFDHALVNNAIAKTNNEMHSVKPLASGLASLTKQDTRVAKKVAKHDHKVNSLPKSLVLTNNNAHKTKKIASDAVRIAKMNYEQGKQSPAKQAKFDYLSSDPKKNLPQTNAANDFGLIALGVVLITSSAVLRRRFNE